MLSVVLRRTPLLALACLALGGTCRPRIDAPAPTIARVAPLPLPVSRIDTFVRIPLGSIAAAADEVVPRRFRVDPYAMLVEGTEADPVVTAGYDVERERLTIDVSRGRIVLRTQLAYWVRARRHVGPLDVPVSCGIDEPRRHFSLAVAIDARIDPSLELLPSFAVEELEAVDRCEMTFANVDVTGRVKTSLRRELEHELPALRSRVQATVALRREAERAFAELSEPVTLDDGTFFRFGPEAISVAQPVLEGQFLRVGLSLRARPEVRLDRPLEAAATAMPTASTEIGTPGIEMHVPVFVPYSTLERSLAEEFRLDSGGIRYPPNGRRFVRPTHVTLYGYGSTIVIRVEFTGFADGVLYLIGTPTLDETTQTVSFPDLDYTVETRSLLMRLASSIRAEDIRNDLRERIHVDLREKLDATRVRLSQALRRRMGSLELQGAIDMLRVVAIDADPDSQMLRATVRATGVVSAQVVGD